MKYVLGVDIGTEGTKVVAVDETGNVVAKTGVSYQFDIPQSGWVEQEPEVWWSAFVSSLSALWEQGVSQSDIIALGVAGQMHSTVLLNREGEVIRKAILWNDVRTKQVCDNVLSRLGNERYQGITCNSLLPGFTLGKLLWLMENEPDNYGRITKVLMPKDFINHRLTGKVTADVSDASGTGVFNVRNRTWHEELMRELDVPWEWFPTVFESCEVIGKVTKKAAAETGLLAGTPVIAGAADNAAAAVGLGTVKAGSGLVSVGTSGVVLTALDRCPSYEFMRRQNPTLHVFCHGAPGMWYGMGVTLSAGSSLRWFREAFGNNESYSQMMNEIRNTERGSNGLVFLPFLTGERTPYNSDVLRGGFLGIGLRHRRPDFIRAIMEGVSYSLRECLDLITPLCGGVNKLVATGGVVHSDVWLQMLSDILSTTVTTRGHAEGAAFGVALLAGLTQGMWNDVSRVTGAASVDRTFIPTDTTGVYDTGFQAYKKYARALTAGCEP